MQKAISGWPRMPRMLLSLPKKHQYLEPTGIAKIVADTKAKKEETEKAISVPEANLP